MRSILAACSQILLSGLLRSGRLLITAVLWLLPALVLSQVPSPGDADPASLPDYADQHVLQVGAFADPANAARLEKDIRQEGFPVLIRSTIGDTGDTLTSVLAGPYASRNAAQSAKAALETHGWPGFLRTEQILAQQHSTEQVSVQQPHDAGRAPPGARVGGTQVNLAQDQAQLFAQAERELFEVPPVIERPLGMEEGPRVVVRAFDLSGAVDREKQDLFVSDVEAILAGRVRLQSPDGYTINQLQGIADEVTRYYRERGFVIAQAIVPAQEVGNGVVSLRVLEGSLEDVRVEDNNTYKAKVIEGPFRRLRGYPITQEGIERALLDVQNFPGLTVFGTFTQGDELGNTDLIVKVREEDRFDFSPSVDNYGSEFTGEYRAMLDFKFNNLFGVADQLNGYVLQTFEPDNGTYGGLSFRFPFGRNGIGFGASTNQFDVGGLEGLTELGVEGTVDQADIYWDRTFANGRFFGASARLGVATKKATTELPGFDSSEKVVLNEDNLAVASLVFDFFAASRKGRGFSVGSIKADVGMPDTLGSMDGSGVGGDALSSRVGGDGERAGGSFEKYKFNFQHLRRVGTNNSVLLRVDGQWSDDILVALEQYSIGGPQNVRAYPIAETLVDTGASATLEWIMNAPGFADKPTKGSRTWGELFQVSLFADYAYGELNNPRASEEPSVDYSGFGLGLQFNVPDKFYGRIDVASPIGSREATNDRDPQYYFRMSYTF
jgi:hemolysin activation/secretion protein